MKAFYIPMGILVGLLALSLWSGHYVQQRGRQWIALLDEAQAAAQAERWPDARRCLARAEDAWEADEPFLRTVMEHRDLDETRACLAGALAACRQQDSVEFHIHMGQLREKLTLLAQTQTVSIQNVL